MEAGKAPPTSTGGAASSRAAELRDIELAKAVKAGRIEIIERGSLREDFIKIGSIGPLTEMFGPMVEKKGVCKWEGCGVEFTYMAPRDLRLPLCLCRKHGEEMHRMEDQRRADAKHTATKVVRPFDDRWAEVCSDEFYRAANPLKLPRPDKWKEAQAWKYAESGLLLHGPSRTGKSMIAHLLAKREMAEGRSLKIINDYRFSHQCVTAFRDGYGEAFVASLYEVDLLLWDDLGKMPISERALGEMAGVFETRTAGNKRMIVTTEFPGAALVKRLGVERGCSIVGRLKDKFFMQVDFATR
jgi:DNA replication protein DnaC